MIAETTAGRRADHALVASYYLALAMHRGLNKIDVDPSVKPATVPVPLRRLHQPAAHSRRVSAEPRLARTASHHAKQSKQTLSRGRRAGGPQQVYNLPEAVSTLKKLTPPKFDQTVTMSFRLALIRSSPTRWSAALARFRTAAGKQVRVLVSRKATRARRREAGAEYVGYKDMIQKCQEAFRISMSRSRRPAAMAEVRKLGKVLGHAV
jgi:hypothetical protein